jgi:hypothetical protein
MEFFDPKRQRAHKIRLTIGYVLICLIIVLTTVILLYWAQGYGLKDGEVIQSGRVFISSRPSGAEVHINGKKHREKANTSILMEAGQYKFELKRDGYRPWKRAINVEGGSVSRFDYPVLFPTKLTTSEVKRYDSAPSMYLHSPDRRWLLVQHGSSLTFDMFDFDNREDAPKEIAIPSGIISSQDGQTWEFLEWSNDNRHVLLRHAYQKDGQTNSEYILFDHEEPGKSVNLTRVLGTNPSSVKLRDKKYDQYFMYDQSGQKLYTASLKDTKPILFLDNILDFKSHGDDKLLYVTTESQPADKASVRLREGDVTYNLRQVTRADRYLLDMAEYERDWFVAVGDPTEDRTYIYKNPVASLKVNAKRALVPVHIFKLADPNFMAFSDTTRFIAAQSGTSFAVFDAENEKAYAFQLKTPLDAPQQHAKWMDGHRLMAVSGGKTVVFDFDNANQEVLADTDPAAGMFFDRQYRYLYTVTNQTTKNAEGKDVTQRTLQRTPLLTEADL